MAVLEEPAQLQEEPTYKHRIPIEMQNQYGIWTTTTWIERQIFPERLWIRDNFKPSKHMEAGLLAQSQLIDIQKNNRTILSVNSGMGFFETLLVKGWEIPGENITLLGIGPLSDEKSVYRNFKAVIRNDMMQKNWDCKGRHDYVIIAGTGSITEILVENAFASTTKNGQIRIDNHGKTFEEKEIIR